MGGGLQFRLNGFGEYGMALRDLTPQRGLVYDDRTCVVGDLFNAKEDSTWQAMH